MHLTHSVGYRVISRSEEYRKMGDRKMMMLLFGADHFSVPHLPVNPLLLDGGYEARSHEPIFRAAELCSYP